MSAFVVDTTCMDRVVRGFALMQPRMFNQDSLTASGRQFFKLNIEAVQQRYGGLHRADPIDDIEGGRATDYEYTEPPEVPGCPPDIDSLKAMHCLIYQCSEGDVPEQRLYQLLVEISQKLEARIRAEHGTDDIHDMPAYQRAEW